jgi:hypothetical protein
MKNGSKHYVYIEHTQKKKVSNRRKTQQIILTEHNVYDDCAIIRKMENAIFFFVPNTDNDVAILFLWFDKSIKKICPDTINLTDVMAQ